MKVDKIKTKTDRGYWVSVNRDEALDIITSLSQQISKGDSGRIEFCTAEGEYFTIGVSDRQRKMNQIEREELERMRKEVREKYKGWLKR